MQQSFESFQKSGKENLDLAVKSMTAVSKGYQAIAAEVVDYSKKAVEDVTATFEKYAGVKSFEKAVEVNTEVAKAAYETAVARMTKIGELYTEMAQEAMKPFEGAMGKFEMPKFDFSKFDLTKFSPAAFAPKK